MSLYCKPFQHIISTNVKRSLFGPIDQVETQKFLEKELSKMRTAQSERWNFDFEKGVPLNEVHEYQWKIASPTNKRRPTKRPVDLYEGEDLYAMPEELIIRPTPIRLAPERDDVTELRKTHQKPQRLITDFMPVKKRSSTDRSTKVDWLSSMERPDKLPRLSELSS